MQLSYFVVVLTVIFDWVDSNHFRGGTITWKPVNASAVGSSTVDIIIEQSYSWKRSLYLCNDTTISTQGSIGDVDHLQCLTTPNCGGYNGNITTDVQCQGYSVSEDLSSGQKSSLLTLANDSQLALNFNGGAWLTLQMGGLSWSITTVINLQPRLDNGRLNTPPVSNILPIISIPLNIQSTIMIPVADDDNDYIRCRWAESNHMFVWPQSSFTVNECTDVCHAVPNSTLFGDNNGTSCRLVFTSTSLGYYAVAIQIEDFYINRNITSPLSSVSLQFLIYVYNGNCWPSIVGVYSNGASISIAWNINMSSVTVTAQIGCAGTNISDFLKMSPKGMTTSIIVQNPTNSSLYSIELNWTPTTLGSQTFCCAAIDDNLAQSDPYCLTFIVVGALNTTTVISTTTTTTTNVPLITSPKGPNVDLIVGMSLLGLLAGCAVCSCCFCCCWQWIEWLCPALKCVCCRDGCKRRGMISTKTNANSKASQPNKIDSDARSTRLSDELTELEIEYARQSWKDLKQSFSHIRNSLELVRKDHHEPHNHRSMPFRKQQISSVTVTKVSRPKISTMPTVFC